MQWLSIYVLFALSFIHLMSRKNGFCFPSQCLKNHGILPVNVDANNSVGFGQSHGFRCFHHWQSLCRPKRDNQAGAAVFKAEPQLNPSSFVASCSTRLSRKWTSTWWWRQARQATTTASTTSLVVCKITKSYSIMPLGYMPAPEGTSFA